MPLSRRGFIGAGAAATVAFLGLRKLGARPSRVTAQSDYGTLNTDKAGILDLPEGFSYQVFSRTGDPMDDGFLVPGHHDGMAAFPGPRGRTLLVRNHEVQADDVANGPFGPARTLRARLDPALIYDNKGLGGTTTLIYDTTTRRLEGHFLSLVGTVRNCAGGPTPWNSWVSCEESVEVADSEHDEDHGFNFEVPAGATGPVRPVPLRAMGRFNHEAVAVDAGSGVVYQTEDRANGLLYRFIPNSPGRLSEGGRLQALRVLDLPGLDTSNNRERRVEVGRVLEVDWVDLEEVTSPNDDLRMQGFTKGAARFSRGEGMWSEPGTVYFACTSGGANRAGQIWRYRSSDFEGTNRESDDRPTLELFVEPNDANLLDQADNLALAPWGDLIISEDGRNGNYVRGLTPDGSLYTLAHNAMNDSEFAGATFSPDGTTLFVNIQRPGLTLAVWGPWRKG